MKTESKLRTIVVATSTLPASPDDPVPAFVSDQLSAIHALHPELDIHVLAPHNAYTKTRNHTRHTAFQEYRFHYLWPRRLELLAGRGIGPALKAHKWLYLAIPFLFIREYRALRRLVKQVRPDILYVHWFTPQALIAAPIARRHAIPLVFTTHASDIAVLKVIPKISTVIQAVCRQAAAYTAVSDMTADRLRAFWPTQTPLENKLTIIPMGTHLPTIEPTDSVRQTIVFIGRLVSRKGVADLITAFASLKTTARLIIAGDGQDQIRLQQHAKQAGVNDRCQFVGYVSGQAKADLLARATILCLPSINEGLHGEGLPVVLMEGLAAGACIVASDATGAQEYITDGKDGYIFPQGNTTALADQLQTCLDLTKSQSSAVHTAARLLAQNFSWPIIAKRHYTVLSDAVSNFDS